MGYVIKDFYKDWDDYFRHKTIPSKKTEDNREDRLLYRDPGPLLSVQERVYFQEEAKKDGLWQ